MMNGITATNQQVPIPQNYLGANAWRIPLKPVPAKEPMSAKTHFMRGAIALAANGIPIFNALNNRGDDAKAFGELDNFGGHCGKADDYWLTVGDWKQQARQLLRGGSGFWGMALACRSNPRPRTEEI